MIPRTARSVHRMPLPISRPRSHVQTGLTQGAAPHHDPGATGDFHLERTLHRGDVTIGHDRYSNSVVDFGDALVSASPLKRQARPSVNSDERDALTLGNLRDPGAIHLLRDHPSRVLSVTGTSTAPATAPRIRPISGSSHQRRAAARLHTFLTAPMLMSMTSAPRPRRGGRLPPASPAQRRYLNPAQTGIITKSEAVAGLGAVPQSNVRVDHLRNH